MDYLFAVLISLVISLFPAKRILLSFFLIGSEKYNMYYNIKSIYNILGMIGYLIPLLDFVKIPLLYISLSYFNMEFLFNYILILVILFWYIINKKELIYNRGVSFFLGMFLILDLSLFQSLLVIYLSLILLTRFQSIAGFITGLLTIPIYLTTNTISLEFTFMIISSTIILVNYKDAFFQVLDNSFFHLFS